MSLRLGGNPHAVIRRLPKMFRLILEAFAPQLPPLLL
jgi:hypothetical protein